MNCILGYLEFLEVHAIQIRNVKIKFIFIFLAAIFFLSPAIPQTKVKPGRCELYGKIQFVKAFPDVKVQVVKAFPDIRVQKVAAFPDKPGKWQIVDSLPDWKVQIVDAFPDYKIQWVDAFPGCE
jgi:hypothetical protein